MKTTTSVPVAQVPTGFIASQSTRWLYAGYAALLLFLTVLGFQQFYLHGRAYPAHEIPAPIKIILVMHGVGMTSWMILFFVQPLLIATANRRLHMSLGMTGAALAALLVPLGLYVPIAAARIEPDVVLWGLHRKAFMAIPFFAILLFGAFVAIGVRYRRRAEIHRPMMLLATLSIVAAPMDRITGLPGLWAGTAGGHWFGPFFGPIVIGVSFLVVRAVLTRSFDRRLATGLVALSAVCALVMRIAPTQAWASVTNFLVG